jgi:GT2 family glycosyltransferase
VLIKKEVFEKIGLLDKNYFAYWEDVDFCQRAKRTGFKVVYAPNAIIWHKNASSSGRPGSVTHMYYQTRNRLIFGFCYASLRTKMALFRESLRFLISGGVKRKAVWDFYLGKLGRGEI